MRNRLRLIQYSRYRALPGIALLPLLTGCPDLGYLLSLAEGQAEVLASSVPIEDVLADPETGPERRRKIELLLDARAFSGSLGLNLGNSYTQFYDTDGAPTAWNVSAARRSALVPRIWTFPIVGEIEYIGFFEQQAALDYRDQLEAEGWDTFVYGVDAYSTLGFLPDPVHSTFLDRNDTNLVETLIHELAHNTVFAPGQSVFNESLATFVGRAGAIRYIESLGPENAELAALLRQRYADQDRVTAWFNEVTDNLRAYYRQDLPAETLIAGREAVFQAARDNFVENVLPTLHEPERHAWRAELPTNNAYILLNGRYYRDLDLFQAAYASVNEDFPAFLDLLREFAASGEPWSALQSYVESR